MNYKFIPYLDQVLILPEEEKTQTESGIYAPNKIGDQQKIALVVAVGKGKYTDKISAHIDEKGNRVEEIVRIPIDVKVGEKVLYKNWGTTPVMMNGKEHFLIKQEDVLSIVEEVESNSN